MVIRKEDLEKAEITGELDGIFYYGIGELIGSKWKANRLIPRNGTFIGYNWEQHEWLIKLDQPINGSYLYAISSRILE